MEEDNLKKFAQQLRQPHDETGVQVAERMNVHNGFHNRLTIKLLNIQPDDSILETGMGNGFFVGDIVMAAGGVKYTGLDISSLMVEEAGGLNKEYIENGQARFVLRESDEMPFPAASFDKIFTVNTLYFWERPEAELAELKRVLKPDGQLLIAIRPSESMQKLPFVKYGFRLYSEGELREFLTANGFKLDKVVEEREPAQEINGQMVRLDSLIACASILKAE